ncbi:isoleucine--tRNA ligase [Alkaliflexus imshenetskii]|uniref:isoleucine--tRNA ligase n=1 Tax=Alkaliflexus imshenetskii TaxID=286730 RepID=UPI00047E6550|nr:isoleucine--tRNA ligase [Alkaliflexus imshenetskii]
MGNRFSEYKGLDLSSINKEVLKKWEDDNTFEQSLKEREGQPSFIFYEGPPSANGMPGIHHVMSRTIKDVVCRYKTQQGHQVHRKAGWDTHGLPVELGVEKALGITKEDIGKSISVADYNKACRVDVMKYTDMWEDLTHKMGYWVDMENPYITFDNRYIETLWWMLKELYKKGLLYKGYTIQPYSPAAGTGLSTHELNQPGCYRDVKDTTCTAQFKVVKNGDSDFVFDGVDTDLFFLAWTTTPWTLPSNTALAVGPNITYVRVRTFNPYTSEPVTVILAKDLLSSFFSEKNAELKLSDYVPGDKKIPFEVTAEYTGEQLKGIRYEQLVPWIKPDGDAFRVITGDFVTTEDGTGIVHIAPTFGADDDRVAKVAGIAPLILIDRDGKRQPMVDRTGKFFLIKDLDADFVRNNVNIDLYGEFAGRYVKNAYDDKLGDEDATLDVDLSVMLKKENKAFRVEKHVHNYPHCWRTDKPVLYYPLDSWFIKTTAVRDRMIELNNTINWKPESTGTGRFGKWLENLVDWNLSRSRYWGTPLPIWRTEDGSSEICIGSVEELMAEINKAIKAGVMTKNPFEGFEAGDFSDKNYDKIDLHRPYVDDIVLVSDKGQPMYRESDLIDVWFDSGAMPYAQMHFPFENKDAMPFPADFIAEGVDQTRGWFFTLHALSTMLFDSVAFKNIISNGLVLDKNGNKMSKRLGNAVDPFKVIDEYGSDPLRWYMMTNSQPWDNLKFDISGIDEVKRKFFGTLYNTYSFFALYANVDGFKGGEAQVPVAERPEIDRWVISLLNTLIKEVVTAYENYEPTRAGRAIQDFVTENLSNWYVRLNRKRFWGGEFDKDKLAAYQTLYSCLETVAVLGAPIAPFYMDRLYTDLNTVSKTSNTSVHLALMPVWNESLINKDLEERMSYAQQISSMVLALRRKVSIKVRQPLQKIMVPVLNPVFETQLEAVKDLILAEVNVKELEYLKDSGGVLVKKIKPNFKSLGPKHSKLMKDIAAVINNMTGDDISRFEQDGKYDIIAQGQAITLELEDVEILSEDIPGWLVANEGRITVALDITVTEVLKEEGIARELINRIQNLRKESGLDVTDKIKLTIARHEAINKAVEKHKSYIGSQTLAAEVILTDKCNDSSALSVEIDTDVETTISIEKY